MFAIRLPVSLALLLRPSLLPRLRDGRAALPAGAYFLQHSPRRCMAWSGAGYTQPVPSRRFNMILVELVRTQPSCARPASAAGGPRPGGMGDARLQVDHILAGLKAIPRAYYEAARRRCQGVAPRSSDTLPLLRPTIRLPRRRKARSASCAYSIGLNMTNGGWRAARCAKPLVLRSTRTALRPLRGWAMHRRRPSCVPSSEGKEHEDVRRMR